MSTNNLSDLSELQSACNLSRIRSIGCASWLSRARKTIFSEDFAARRLWRDAAEAQVGRPIAGTHCISGCLSERASAAASEPIGAAGLSCRRGGAQRAQAHALAQAPIGVTRRIGQVAAR